MNAALRYPAAASIHHAPCSGHRLPKKKDDARIVGFIALCKAKAWQFHRGKLAQVMERRDLVGIGMEAVCKAAKTWDTERGATFETYVYEAVLHAMLQEKLRYGRLARTGITRSLSLAEEDQDDTEFELRGLTQTPEQIVSDAQLRSFVEKLPHPFARVAERHFSGESLADVGKAIGRSRERVRQIEWKAMRMLEKAVLSRAERRLRRGK